MEDSRSRTRRPRVAQRPAARRLRARLWILCLLPGAVACAASHNETDRTALRADHEQCLQDARGDAGRVSYRGYQACMDALGWPALDRVPTTTPI